MLFYINYITTCKPLRGSSVFCYGLVGGLIEAERVCGDDGQRLSDSLSMQLELHTSYFIDLYSVRDAYPPWCCRLQEDFHTNLCLLPLHSPPGVSIQEQSLGWTQMSSLQHFQIEFQCWKTSLCACLNQFKPAPVKNVVSR